MAYYDSDDDYVGYAEPDHPAPARTGYARAEPAYSGYVELVPPSNYNRQTTVANEVQTRVRESYNDRYSRSSSTYTESYKAQNYAHMGYKHEEKYTLNEKHVDKVEGLTREREVQVKVKDAVFTNKGSTSTSKSNNNRINYY